MVLKDHYSPLTWYWRLSIYLISFVAVLQLKALLLRFLTQKQLCKIVLLTRNIIIFSRLSLPSPFNLCSHSVLSLLWLPWLPYTSLTTCPYEFLGILQIKALHLRFLTRNKLCRIVLLSRNIIFLRLSPPSPSYLCSHSVLWLSWLTYTSLTTCQSMFLPTFQPWSSSLGYLTLIYRFLGSCALFFLMNAWSFMFVLLCLFPGFNCGHKWSEQCYQIPVYHSII